MVNTILAKRVNHIVAKGDNPAWPKGSKSRGFSTNGYLQWAECGPCGHICPESFWRNYRTYGFGVAYKPCVVRGRNHYGNLRIGASAGSDTKKFLGGLHFGYEHNYVLRSGWTLYWQAKSDLMIKGADLLRVGVALGVKLPIK